MKRMQVNIRDNVLSILTGAVLIALFSLYFFGYVKNQEQVIKERNFRVLSRVAENLLEKNRNVGQNLLNFNEKIKEFIKVDSQRYTVKNLLKIKGQVETQSISLENYLDSIPKELFRSIEIEFLSIDSLPSDSPDPNTGPYLLPPNKKEEVIYYDILTKNGHNFLAYHIFTSSFDSKLENPSERVRIQYATNIQEFVTPLIREDVFEEFIVFDSAQLFFRTFSTSLSPNQLASLIAFDSTEELSHIKPLIVAGKPYKAFLQPVEIEAMGQPVHIWIGALMDQETYDNQSYKIPNQLLLTIILAILLIVLGLPFLRLRLMHKKERLRQSNVILVAMATVFGSAVVVLLLYHGYNRVSSMLTQEPQGPLEHLARKISSNFTNEIQQASSQLTQYEEVFKRWKENDPDYRSNSIPFKKDNENLYNSNSPLVDSNYYDSLFQKNSDYPHFYNAYWIDAKGDQLWKWTPQSFNTPKINVEKRAYFQAFQDPKPYRERDKLYRPQDAYFVESIISLTNSEVLGAVSRRSELDDAEVVALTSRLYSVIDPVIPRGFGFCIIGESGQVLFHHKKERNLQENFLEECDNSSLRSAIAARTALHASASYYGRPHWVYIRPIQNLPFFLVTFQEKSLEYTANEQTLTTSIISMLIHLSGIMVFLFAYSFFSQRKSKLEARAFLFNWLKPDTRKAFLYKALTIAHIFSIIIGVGFTMAVFINASLKIFYTIWIFGVVGITTFIVSYLILNDNTIPGKRNFSSATTRGLFSAVSIYSLISFFVGFALFQGTSDPSLNERTAIWHTLVFLMVWAYPFVLTIGMRVLLNRSKTDVSLPPNKFKSRYTGFLFTWLLVISVVPAMVFYHLSYNTEKELLTKYRQLHLAQDLQNQQLRIENICRLTQPIDDKSKGPSIEGCLDSLLKQNAYYSFFAEEPIRSEETDTCQNFKRKHRADFSIWLDLRSKLRPLYSEQVVQTNQLFHQYSADCKWFWVSPEKSPGILKLLFPTDDGYFKIESRRPRPSFSSSILSYGIIFLIAGIGLYYLINFVVLRLFALNLVHNEILTQFDKGLLISPDNVFLIVPPHPARGLSVQKYHRQHKGSWDRPHNLMKEDPEKIKFDEVTGKPSVFFDHFEYKIEDPEMRSKKLSLLENVLSNRENLGKIVIASVIQPHEIEEYYKEEAEINKTPINRQEKNRWSRILSSFYKLYVPLTASKTSDLGKSKNSSEEHLIMKESEPISFLQSIQKDLIAQVALSKADRNKEDRFTFGEEEIILKIQSLAQNYYHALWQGCTKDEKYILYDLADNGLVNVRNTSIVNRLLSKGLIVNKYGQLHIFNESFRNYMLSKIDPKEALQLELEQRAQGGFSKFQTPILIVLFTLALFILTTQEQTYNHLITILTTLTATLPIFFRTFAMLSPIQMLWRKTEA